MYSRPRPRILLAMGAFFPEAAANGPVRSAENLIEALSDEFVFAVLARDRPFNATTAEPGIMTRRWIPRGPGEVCYLPPEDLGRAGVVHAIAASKFDILHLNGFFDREFTQPALVGLRLGRIPNARIILSPRGEFARGALASRPFLKRTFLAISRIGRLHSNVWYQASTEREATDVLAGAPPGRGILIAPNIPAAPKPPQRREPKRPGHARLVFVGRISPMKNLIFAVEALGSVRGEASFDIWGPIEDPAHWAAVQEAAARVSARVTVVHRGTLAPHEVSGKLADYDLFYSPTRGENYGHAIVEALAAGLPALISDRTPWTGLAAAGCGWALPLDDSEAFARAVDDIVILDEAGWARCSDAARRYAEERTNRADAIAASRALYRRVLDER